MRILFPLLALAGLCLLLVLQATPAVAQNRHNDGFQRRNGQMHVLRNGQLRPMTRDARLPTGAVVTKDGFIRAANGKRTELREGQGCDLKGNIVAVVPVAGGLALGFPRGGQRQASAAPTVVRLTLEDLFGGGPARAAYERDDDDDEDGHKRSKKWKQKWKKGKDD